MQNDAHPIDLSAQTDFWSQNPCGTDGSLLKKMKQRYRMEPWIPCEIASFPSRGVRILEVGCGQGVDAFNICARLDSASRYIAIDYSTESIRRCADSIEEAKSLFSLGVIPEFRRGDALALPFAKDEFDFVYSFGAIHHTPDPPRGIKEVHRVLTPGGRCVVVLYRYGSLKVGVAKLLRAFQAIIDKITGRERTIYEWLKTKKIFSDTLGTMLLECFGVPWMYWYTRRECEQIFADFSRVRITPCGFNLHLRSKVTSGYNPFGYYYKIEAEK